MARRTRPEAPSLARTRSAAPAVGILLDYAAPELTAWVSANREAVLRAAEAVDAAYVAEVDALAPLLPGGETVWERASASLTIYDSESEEHRARKPSRIENVEGWQSRVADKHGKREVLALLPVRLPASEGFVARLDNRWVSGHGSDRVWTLTTAWPSPETPLELAGYEMRRRGVDVSQQTGEEGGGGSTMPTDKKPVLDPIHQLVVEAFRLERRKPLPSAGADTRREVTKFNKTNVHWFLEQFFSPEAIKAVGEPTMMRRARKALLDGGDLALTGFLDEVRFTPAERLTQAEYGRQRRAMEARSNEAARLTREQTAVTQPTEGEGRGSDKPVLDPIHELVMEAYLLQAVRPQFSEGEDRYAGFSPGWVSGILRRSQFSDRAQAAVVHPSFPGVSIAPSLVRASQMKHIREALVNAGAVVPAERSGSGAVVGWRFAPATPLSPETYEQARAALAARAAALVADGTPLGDRLAFAERMRGARG